MSPIDKNMGGRGRPWRSRLSAALAGLGWLAACFGATAQVSVDTIGGGVRLECGPASGFTNGNTYDVAQFNAPWSCALDTNGNLWIADRNNNDLEQVSRAGNKAASVTTEYYQTNIVSGHVVTNFHFLTNITSVAVDPANNLYVLLATPPQVFKCDLTAQSTTLNVLSVMALTNAPASAAATAMVVDGHSNVFLALTNGSIIRFPLIDGNPPPTLYSESYVLGDSPLVHYVVTNFNWQPAGLALLANGQLAVSDTLSNAIYVVSTNDYTANSGPRMMTGGHGAGFDDGPPAFATFNQPHGLAASSDGSLIVCDTANNRVRAIDSASNTITLYGTDSNIWPATCCSCTPTHYAGWVDGVAGITFSNATARQPFSVAISPSGSLFVTELYYSLIRQVTNTSYSPVNVGASFPVAVTKPATGNMNGSVFAGDSPTYYYFEWGTSTNYDNFTVTNLLTTNLTSPQDVIGNFVNLLPGLTYHFQLVAYNGLGVSFGGDLTAITPAIPALVSTQPATNITANSATLSAIVNPENTPTMVNFYWGLGTNTANLTPLVALTNNLTNNQTVTATISNLQSGTIYYFQAVADNSGGLTNGNLLSFTTQTLPPPMLTISPSNGYYPECVSIAVTSSVPNGVPLVYYTTDGTVPTTNSTAVPMTLVAGTTNYSGTIQWCNPTHDLSSLQVAAFNGGSTTLLQGSSPTTNLVGFPESTHAGSGSTAYIPVVVDLQSSGSLQSLQFRVEIAPGNGAPPALSGFTLQPITANDYVAFAGPAPANAPVNFQTFAYTNPVNNAYGLVIATEPGSGLSIQGFATAVLLRVPIPPTASYGQSYSLSVLYPSGTSDGIGAEVGLTNMPPQELVITDPIYMSGDCSPANGYNAGEFGNGALANGDANNILYALVGIRKPYVDSDAFNSMDVFPETNGLAKFGQGHLVFLDWQITLERALGLNTNNWIRFWTNNGVLSHSDSFTWTPGGTPVPLSDASATAPTKQALGSTPPGLVWYCQASITAGNASHLVPGNTATLPVYANVLPGYSLSGMAFRAVVTPDGNAPAVGQVHFTPAAGLPPPQVLPGLSSNDMVCAWSLGAFEPPLQNSNYLGSISFQVPAGAASGQTYSLHFVLAGGASDNSDSYQMEGFPGAAGVGSAALPAASITSDDWKMAFFGSVTNPLAADNVDADGDGASNWQEYLAGTDPTDASSCLKFSSANLYSNGVHGVAINWLTAPGKTYILQSSAALDGANWGAINTNSGDGNEYQVIVTNVGGNARFYQIRLQP